MHEGFNSTRLGLKGMPRIAEDIAVNRNIDLLGYAGRQAPFFASFVWPCRGSRQVGKEKIECKL
jgi:hypothetical protein